MLFFVTKVSHSILLLQSLTENLTYILENLSNNIRSGKLLTLLLIFLMIVLDRYGKNRCFYKPSGLADNH